MALLTEDSFNRADNASAVGSTDGAGSLDPLTWVNATGTCGISSNQFYAPGATFPSVAYVETSSADIDVSITFSTIGSGVALIFRLVDANNYWKFDSGSSGICHLYKVSAGTPTQVGSSISGTVNGDVMRVVANGNKIRAYRNGAILVSTTDTTHNTATKHGAAVFTANTGRLDSFSASSVNLLLSEDGFGRADSSSTLGSTEGAGSLDPLTWTAQLGTCGINTLRANVVATASGGGKTAGIGTIDVAVADVDYTLTLSTVSASGTALIFRYSDTSNYWMWIEDTTSSGLYKHVAGSDTLIGSTHSAGTSLDVVRVVANGSSISVYRSGVLQESTTDSFNQSATKHGFMALATSHRVDSLSISTPTATTVTGTQATETDSSTSGSVGVAGTVYPAPGDRVLALKTETSDSWYGFLT